MATTSKSLAALLFGNYRRQALGRLLLNPQREFHVRELSRVTGTSAGTMHKELAVLSSAGILNRRLQGNQALYSANSECPIFEDLQNILRKTSGIADVLRDVLRPLSDEIDLAFIYGSVARGEEGPGSDIDLMIVGDVPFVAVVAALTPAQNQLGREVNPVAYSMAEFVRKAREKDSFVQRLLREKKMYLIGDENDLGKLVEDQAASGAPPKRRGNKKTSQGSSAAARGRKVGRNK